MFILLNDNGNTMLGLDSVVSVSTKEPTRIMYMPYGTAAYVYLYYPDVASKEADYNRIKTEVIK